MRQSFLRLIISIVSTLWPLATDIWDAWGIQLLVLASFFCQVILVLLGGKRRYRSDRWIGLLIWAAYMLASNISTIALGKLTVVTIRNPENPEYNVELQGLLAPLLLMHADNPDSISAYSVIDTLMGKRRVLNFLVQALIALWILARCFDASSPTSRFLFVPLFIAGIIEPVATIFALAKVHDNTTSVHELMEIESTMRTNGERPGNVPTFQELDRVCMAYHRFRSLRPHQANWIYNSEFVEKNGVLFDELKQKDAFHVTELELGFAYDAMYTQIPSVCTKIGLVSRAISIICLVSALCGFSIIFRSSFLLDPYVTYTYAILIGSVIMELYQVITLPFSYSAVIALWKWNQKQGFKCKTITKVLGFLVQVCQGQKMWSNLLGQLNLVEHCLKGDFLKPVSCIVSKIDPEKKFRKCWGSTHKTVEPYLKKEIIDTTKKLEEKILSITPKDIKKGRGLLTLELDDFNIPGHVFKSNLDISYMNRGLDKCIIIWHLATDCLLPSNSTNLDASSTSSSSSSSSSSMIGCCGRRSNNPSPLASPPQEIMMVGKLLSNYMMYLLMDHPYMLSLTTSDITLKYTSSKLKAALAKAKDKHIRQQLPEAIMETDQLGDNVQSNSDYKAFITERWDVLTEVKQLVTELQKLNDVKWKFVSAVWIEMLCYAAYKSQLYNHLSMLRKGGELITHVWLLLLHKTDRYPYHPPSHPANA